MRGSFKADPLPLIRAHWATLVDVRTGRRRYRDYVGFAGIPLAVLGVCLWRGVTLSATTAGALLTAIGLLGAFLFAVMLQVAARAVDWADSAPTPSRETSDHSRFLRELAANAGYASLTAMAAAAAYVAAIVMSGWPLRVSASVGLALTVHLALVLLMVMKRVFALIEERLDRARTGAASNAAGGSVVPHRRARGRG